MSSRVFIHLLRVSLVYGIFYSSQRLHMEVNTSRNYHNINTSSLTYFHVPDPIPLMIEYIGVSTILT
jgi:hypothetical protein